jgi:NADH-quinone oxidoreductase subunit J
MNGQMLVFWVLAAVGTLSALMVVTRRNPVHSALYLVVTFFTVAAVYVLLHAEFIAVVQVLVYAGGIMVLFLFVILLVEVKREHGLRTVGSAHVVSSVLLTALAVGSVGAYSLAGAPDPAAGDLAALTVDGGNLETVAMMLFRYYLLPFEVISILLLVALVGAVVLARSRF